MFWLALCGILLTYGFIELVNAGQHPSLEGYPHYTRALEKQRRRVVIAASAWLLGFVGAALIALHLAGVSLH